MLVNLFFGNARLPSNKKPLFFKLLSKSGLKRSSDIWDYQNETFLDNITMYNKLQNKRNWISDWFKLRPQSQKTLDTCTNKRKCKLYIDNNLCFVIVKIKLFNIKMLN